MGRPAINPLVMNMAMRHCAVFHYFYCLKFAGNRSPSRSQDIQLSDL